MYFEVDIHKNRIENEFKTTSCGCNKNPYIGSSPNYFRNIFLHQQLKLIRCIKSIDN